MARTDRAKVTEHPRLALDPDLPEGLRRRLLELNPHRSPEGPPQRRRVWNRRRHLTHGRYVAPHDLDPDSCKLLIRAQRAIDLVLSSEVNKAGLLDQIHNRIALSRQEWEIAKTLRGLTKLRARHPDLETETAGVSPAAAALQTSVQQVTDRVTALETYAEQVKLADVSYHLDRTRDRHAALELDDLTDQARVAVHVLQRELAPGNEA